MQKILVIMGSTRPNRKSEQVAKWFMEAVKGREEFSFELADLKDFDLPFLDEPKPPMAGQYQNEHTKRWAAVVNQADGFVLITPEYNHGYSAVLKNALDFAYAEWNRKPIAFVSYGVVGGIRAVEQLKQVVIQLEMVPLNAQVSLPLWNNWTKEGEFTPVEHSQQDLTGLLDNLAWWGEALKTAREKR